MRLPKVFLVDAFDDERDMYAEYLSLNGFEVCTFGTADSALDGCASAAPDAVVTRIRQTSGTLDGIGLTARLRTAPATRHTAIVVITTSMLPADREAAARAGCDAYLVLPTMPDDLVTALRSVLRIRQLDDVTSSLRQRAAPGPEEEIT